MCNSQHDKETGVKGSEPIHIPACSTDLIDYAPVTSVTNVKSVLTYISLVGNISQLATLELHPTILLHTIS